MSEFIRLQANGEDAFPDASSQNTYRDNGTSVEASLVALEGQITTLGGVAGEAKTLAEQNSVKIATAEQEISDINSSLTEIKRFVDFGNKLYEKTYYNESFDYTATEDCFISSIVSAITQGKHSSIVIENECTLASVWGPIGSNIGLSAVVQIYVKKGQTLHLESDETNSSNQSIFTVYGLQ